MAIPNINQMTSDSYISHRNLTVNPSVVTHAKGKHLYSTNGVIMDACGGAAVVSVGHSNPAVYTQIQKQLEDVSYVHSLEYTTPATEKFGQMLLEDYKTYFGRVYIANSGTEVTNAALKLCIQYFHEKGLSSKTEFISRSQSYHGNCLGSLSLSGHPGRRHPFEPILNPHMHKVSPAYEYRYKKEDEDTSKYVERLAKELESKILELGPENVAAFFAETVVGATLGCVSAPEGYFKVVRELCDKYDILLVLDEIMCGSGRTGKFFAWEHEGIVPDIVTCGKSLSSGYAPLSACLYSHKIVQAIKQGSCSFNSGHTYQAYPLACAAGTAVLLFIREHDLLSNVDLLGQYLKTLLHLKILPLSIVGDVRGKGFFWGVEFVRDKATKEPFESSLKVGYRVKEVAFSKGMAIYPGSGTADGKVGDHILIAPMYISSKDDLDFIVDTLYDSIISVTKELS